LRTTASSQAEPRASGPAIYDLHERVRPTMISCATQFCRQMAYASVYRSATLVLCFGMKSATRTPNVRLSPRAHTLLRQIADEDQQSMQAVLDNAIERYRRERFLHVANADFAALKESKSVEGRTPGRGLWNKRWRMDSRRIRWHVQPTLQKAAWRPRASSSVRTCVLSQRQYSSVCAGRVSASTYLQVEDRLRICVDFDRD